MAVAACRLKKTPVVAETPAHKQGHSLLMKTEIRRKRMKLGPTDTVIAESPDKLAPDSAIPSSLPPMSQLMRQSSFYSENPSRNVSKYTKLEERMTQKLLSPPSQKFDSTYVAGSWLTSPRRITPKALFRSLFSPSPSDKSSNNLPRKLNLKSPVRNVGSCAPQDFKSPVKVVGSSTSTAVVATPPRSMACSLSHLDLDSPSRNTRSHVYSGKQGLESKTAVTQQPDTLASPSSLGRRSSKLMSPSRVAITSPDSKQPDHFTSSHQLWMAKSCQVSLDNSSRSCDAVAKEIPAPLPKRAIFSSSIRRAHLTMCDVNAAETYSDILSSGTYNMMKHASDYSSCLRAKSQDEAMELWSPKKKQPSINKAVPFTSTLDQSEENAEGIYGSIYCGTRMSIENKSDQQVDNRKSHKRKKSGEDVCKSSARRRLHRQVHHDSVPDEEDQSTIAADVCDAENSEETALFTALSFGCDTESRDAAVMGLNEKVNSDVLRHLGSSGVESESSSNDVDLMITRKNLLGRKCSSGFQSLGHISETECCPSPMLEAAVGLPTETDQHTASVCVSASPVFGKRQTQSFAGESPCFSLTGSSRKRTPVPGCAESFSPDVSQHSIAHLMTSPLLDGSETLQKTGRNRSSSRRCLDPQMGQSSKRLSDTRHSSSRLTDEDS